MVDIAVSRPLVIVALPDGHSDREINPANYKHTYRRVDHKKMRQGIKAGRNVVVLLIAGLLFVSLGPATAFGQTQQPASSINIQDVINRSEASYLQGEQAIIKGQADQARKLFDEAVEAITQSGIDIASNPRLQAYHRDLVNRIKQYDAKWSEPRLAADQPPADKPEPADNAKPVAAEQTSAREPGDDAERAVLDELAEVNESELATVTPDGVKIFGRYDFEFSVAPPVFQYINYFIAGRGRSTMETGLRRSGRYREMAERIFKEEGVPLDLIWLAQAESVWKPNALSHAAAKGIWQFIPGTGLRYGLAQTAWVDDRSHPEKSTRAAARYLKFLHKFFAGDWLLAMAAYNSGEYRIAGAIAKCGYADFWEIHKRGLIPTETRNYVPIILSIIIVSKNQKRYGFNVQPEPPLNYDTFDVPGQTDLKVAADLIGVPFEALRELNPELRRGATPAGQPHSIKLPKGMKKQFELAYAALPEDQRVRKVVIPRVEVAEERSSRPVYRTKNASYQVQRGDTLAALARRHGVSVKELARLNGLSARTELRKGQTVRIPQGARATRGQKYSSKKAVSSRSSSKVSSKTKLKSKQVKKEKQAVSKRSSSRRRR